MTKRSANGCPEARSDGLLTEAVGDELVIFDTETNEAHALKPLAAAVFAACDGSTPATELAAHVSAKLGRVVDVAEVDAAVVELEETGLLVDSEGVSGISRRRMLQVSGVAAAGVLVTSAIVPAYAAASTTVCAPTSSGSLSCGISEFVVVIQQNGTNNYFWLKLTPNSASTGYETACGGGSFFTICQGSNKISSYNGYPLQSACLLGVTLTVGSSGIAVEVPSGYTLVAWYYHNGQTCLLDQKPSSGTTGCIQINPCA